MWKIGLITAMVAFFTYSITVLAAGDKAEESEDVLRNFSVREANPAKDAVKMEPPAFKLAETDADLEASIKNEEKQVNGRKIAKKAMSELDDNQNQFNKDRAGLEEKIQADEKAQKERAGENLPWKKREPAIIQAAPSKNPAVRAEKKGATEIGHFPVANSRQEGIGKNKRVRVRSNESCVEGRNYRPLNRSWDVADRHMLKFERALRFENLGKFSLYEDLGKGILHTFYGPAKVATWNTCVGGAKAVNGIKDSAEYADRHIGDAADKVGSMATSAYKNVAVQLGGSSRSVVKPTARERSAKTSKTGSQVRKRYKDDEWKTNAFSGD